ncbi:hypothetical protein [Rufibacter tibetensis]|nr:hypothetical protein [Rufibacter tibetensis]
METAEELNMGGAKTSGGGSLQAAHAQQLSAGAISNREMPLVG